MDSQSVSQFTQGEALEMINTMKEQIETNLKEYIQTEIEKKSKIVQREIHEQSRRGDVDTLFNKGISGEVKIENFFERQYEAGKIDAKYNKAAARLFFKNLSIKQQEVLTKGRKPVLWNELLEANSYKTEEPIYRTMKAEDNAQLFTQTMPSYDVDKIVGGIKIKGNNDDLMFIATDGNEYLIKSGENLEWAKFKVVTNGNGKQVYEVSSGSVGSWFGFSGGKKTRRNKKRSGSKSRRRRY